MTSSLDEEHPAENVIDGSEVRSLVRKRQLGNLALSWKLDLSSKLCFPRPARRATEEGLAWALDRSLKRARRAKGNRFFHLMCVGVRGTWLLGSLFSRGRD